MKRTIALLLAALLLATTLATMPVAAAGITATEQDTILIAFSDFQPKDGVVAGQKRLQKIVDVLASYGLNKADGVLVAGDYNASGDYTEQPSISLNTQSMTAIKNTFAPLVGKNILFTQGNHDLAATPGLCPAGNNDPTSGAYGVYVVQEDQYVEWGNNQQVTKDAAAGLKAYLDKKAAAGFKKPIFVVNHIPLHWGNRTLSDGSGTHANLLFDVLNEAGGKGLNIIYLFGHNHSKYDDFLGSSAIYLKKGDQIEIAQGSKYNHRTETLQFTYMNPGYMGYNSSTAEGADTALTLSTFIIRGDEVIITRYDTQGIHNLKSAGLWHPDFTEEGYHAVPNITVYASSRRVTATTDVAVDIPLYSGWGAEDTTTTTTTTTTTGKIPTVTKPGTTTAPEGDAPAPEGETPAPGESHTADIPAAPEDAVQEENRDEIPAPMPNEKGGFSLDGPVLLAISFGGTAVLIAIGVGIYLLISKKKK